MSTGARESAFAKRRRLNDGTSTPASDSDFSAATTTVKKTKATKHVKEVEVAPTSALEADAANRVSSREVLEILDNNSFDPLAGANVVNFSRSREIEAIAQDTIKVRLSRYSRCYIYGIAKLWVRDGSVSAYGATLTESTQAYILFASVSDVPVAVEAQSTTAEFQLENIVETDPAIPSPLMVPGKFGRAAQGDAMSFQVLDHEEGPGHAETPGLEPPRSLHWNSASSKVDAAMHDLVSSAPRILICGKRSSSTSASSIALINRLLSETTIKHSTAQDGVTFLDLDFSSPAFGCPGTISVTRMQTFVLGPSYTHPLAPKSTSRNQVVASHPIGSDETLNAYSPSKAVIEHLMRADKSLLALPWVIRTGAWIATASIQDLTQLHNTVSPDLVLYVDSSKSSSCYDAAVALAQIESTKLAHAPSSRSTAVSYLADHRNALQSHFRLYGYVDDVPLWHLASLPAPSTRRLVLSINDRKKGLSFVALRGGLLRWEDILEVLQEALVTLVVAQATGTKSSRDLAPILLRDVGHLDMHPLGLGYIHQVDELSGVIYLNTPIGGSQIQECLDNGLDLGLILEKPGTSGRFGRQLLFEQT